MFTLEVTPQEFSLLWQCLGKQAAEAVYPLMKKLEAQVQQQELQVGQGDQQ